MNRRPDLPEVLRSVDLAREADFAIGEIAVCPSRRQLAAGGRQETIQPRVMQVLVALVRAKGAVLSREELIESCWESVIVGDDAINRCIAKVRQIAELGGGEAFEIETIPRVGYRLKIRGGTKVTPGPKPAVTAEVGPKPKPTSHSGSRRWLAWTAGTALAMTGAVLIALRPVPEGRARVWQVTETHLPFISTPLIERFPAFSPDGTMIAYAAGPDIYSRNIFIRRRNGGDSLQLTFGNADSIYPAWSPDGGSIAYVEDFLAKPCAIMLVPVPAGPSRQVARCVSSNRPRLSWTPDGSSLVYVDSVEEGGQPNILKFDVRSGSILPVVPSRAAAGVVQDSVALSPNGKTLAYFRDVELVARDLASGRERALFQSTDDFDNIAWSQDSANILITRSTSWSSSLWLYPADGAQPQRLLASPIPLSRPASGPSGLLALELNNVDLELASAPMDDGAEPALLDAVGLKASSLDYAADGTLAVIADHSGNAGIWLREPGKPFREMLSLDDAGDAYSASLRFSPDGVRLAFIEVTAQLSVILIVDRNGAIESRFPISAGEIGNISWCADGRSLLTTLRDGKGWRIWRLDIARSGKLVPISDHGWNFVRASGAMIFATRDGVDGIWRVDGRPRHLSDWPKAGYANLWSVAGDRIYYPNYSAAGKPFFVSQNVTTGEKSFAGHDIDLWLGSEIAVDPQTRRVSYVFRKHEDTDIGWLRIERK